MRFMLLLALCVVAATAQPCTPQQTFCPGYVPDCCDSDEICYTGYHYGICCPDSLSFCSAGFYSSGGGACYDETQQLCCQGSEGSTEWTLCDADAEECCIVDGWRAGCCPKEPTPDPTPRCDSQPYDDNKYVCVDGKFLCPLSAPERCGEGCYASDKYACVDGHLCPAQAPSRCGTSCYNENRYVCHDDGGEPLLCPQGEAPARCGDRCYSPELYVCAEDHRLCPHSQPHFCNGQCQAASC